jgi:hypothetical protein
MTRNASRLLLSLALAGSVLAAWWGLGYVKNFRPPSPFAPPARPLLPADVGLRLRDVRLVGRAEGKRAWILKAARIEGARSRTRLTLSDGLTATPLEPDGKTPQAVIQAPRAVYETLQKKIVAEGGLSMTAFEKSRPKATLSAPRASYDLKNRVLSAVGGTRVTLLEARKPRATLKSPRLRYALSARTLVASGGFVATLLDPKQVTLAGPLARWEDAAQTLTCPEGATLTRGTLVGYSATLKVDLKRGVYSSTNGFGDLNIDEIKEFTP